MRIALIIAASTAALALAACNSPADEAPEAGGEAVEAAAVTDPAAVTVTEEQAAADAAAAVAATETQTEAEVTPTPAPDAPAQPVAE